MECRGRRWLRRCWGREGGEKAIQALLSQGQRSVINKCYIKSINYPSSESLVTVYSHANGTTYFDESDCIVCDIAQRARESIAAVSICP